MSSRLEEIKIAVFGDSISEGIGKRRRNYCEPLEVKLKDAGIRSEIINYSFTGTTIRHIETLKPDFENKKFDYTVIAYGNVDAMLRPDTSSKYNLYAHIPGRYKKTGMLNPRPYFSKQWYKSVLQHLDSWVRWNLNRTLLRLQGGMTRIAPDEFKDAYQKAVDLLLNHSDHIIMLSTVHVGDKYFPGTNEMYGRYNHIIEKIAAENNCAYISLYDSLEDKTQFCEDTFHPNKAGYEAIADLIANEIIENLRREN